MELRKRAPEFEKSFPWRRSILPDTSGEISTKNDEDSQRDHLARKSRNHDIDPRLPQRLILVGGISQGTTNSLQHQTEDVTADEDDSVSPWFEASEMFPVHDDNAREAEIDPCAEEGGGDSQADEISVRLSIIIAYGTSEGFLPLDVQQKWIPEEWVKVHLYSSNVSKDLEHFTTEKGYKKVPCTIADTEEYLDEED